MFFIPGLSEDSTVDVINHVLMSIVNAKVGVPMPDGSVDVCSTEAGIKDGVMMTDLLGTFAKAICELAKIWHYGTRPESAFGVVPIHDVVRTLRGYIHGDNSIMAYPHQWEFLSGTDPYTAKFIMTLGMEIKPEESLYFPPRGSKFDINAIFTMSWHLYNLGKDNYPTVVAWKEHTEF